MSLLRKAFAATAALVLAATLTSTAKAASEGLPSVERTASDMSAQAQRTAWVNNKTGKCLSVRAADNRDGAPVFQFDCSSFEDQFWNREPISGSGGAWRVVNAKTGRCLSVKAADNRNGAPAFQYECRGFADQAWHIVDYKDESGRYAFSTVHNAETERCLAIPSAGGGNGVQAIQHDCEWEWTDQRWVIWR